MSKRQYYLDLKSLTATEVSEQYEGLKDLHAKLSIRIDTFAYAARLTDNFELVDKLISTMVDVESYITLADAVLHCWKEDVIALAETSHDNLMHGCEYLQEAHEFPDADKAAIELEFKAVAAAIEIVEDEMFPKG